MEINPLEFWSLGSKFSENFGPRSKIFKDHFSSESFMKQEDANN